MAFGSLDSLRTSDAPSPVVAPSRGNRSGSLQSPLSQSYFGGLSFIVPRSMEKDVFGDNESKDAGSEWDETPPIETESIWKRATGEFDDNSVELTEPPAHPDPTPERDE